MKTAPCYTVARMDLLFDSLLAAVGLGAGLSVFTGLRAFIPLSLVGLVAHFGVLDLLDLQGTWFEALSETWVIGLLIFLAVVEIVVDKIPLLDSAVGLVAWPIKAIAGAITFGAALAHEDTGVLVAGLIAGGAVAVTAHAVKSVVRPGATTPGTSNTSLNPFISFFEDVAAMLGTVIVLLLPIIGLLLVVFLIFLVYRVRKVRQRKYKGLRILKE
jgi:uncharacterized membrane protein